MHFHIYFSDCSDFDPTLCEEILSFNSFVGILSSSRSGKTLCNVSRCTNAFSVPLGQVAESALRVPLMYLSFILRNTAQILLFSAHISYGIGKYLNQTGFFLQNLPRFYLYLNLRVLPIEFNPHKFSFVRYVFVEIFEVFF